MDSQEKNHWCNVCRKENKGWYEKAGKTGKAVGRFSGSGWWWARLDRVGMEELERGVDRFMFRR